MVKQTLLLLSIILILTSITFASNWPNSTFTNCRNLTILNVGNINLTNFPQLINITNTTNMQSNYSDLRFYGAGCDNGGTLLAYEIENYTASSALVWVGIPNLATGNNTIALYFNNKTQVNSGQNASGVWDSNFLGVWHLTRFNATDSTSNSNNCNGTGVTLNGTGKIDGALNFAGGSSSYLNCSNKSSLHTNTNLTIEAWVNSKATKVAFGKIVYKSYTSNAAPFTEYGLGLDSTGTKYMFEVTTNGTQTVMPGVTNVSNGNWQQIIGIYNGSAMLVYVNGVLENTTPKSGNISNYNRSLFIGSNGMNLAQSWNGTLDEIRISNTIRSPQWINQSYQMEANNSALIVLSSPQLEPINVTLNSPANGSLLNSTSVNFNWTCSSNSSSYLANLTIDGVVNASAINTTNNTATNYSVSGLGQGNHSWSVTCIDSKNNTGSSTPWNFTVDSIAPSVTLTSPANNSFFNVTTLTFNVTASDALAASLNCSLYLNGVLNRTNANLSSNVNTSFTVTGLANGLQNWSATCIDNAGNTGTSTTRSFTIDTTAPTVQSVSPAGGGYPNTTSPTFTFNFTSAVSPTANCSIYIDGVLNQTNASVANNTNTNFTISGFGQGLHNWSISCIDLANNTGLSTTRSFTIDTIAPVIQSVSPANGTYFNTTSQTFTFNFTSASSSTANCSIYIDGVLNQTNASVVNNTNTNFTISGFQQGLHNWSISCMDLGNYTGTGTTGTLTIDTAAPAITLASPANNTVFNVTTIVFNFTAVDNISSTLNCSLLIDASVTATNASVLNNTLTDFTVPGIGLGNHIWSVACTDSAGNTGMSEAWNFSVDTDAPVVVLSSPSNNTLFNTSSVTFSFNSTDAVHLTGNCSIYIDGIKNQTNESVNNGTLTSFSVTGIPDGIHSWNVQCLDAAFNLGNSPTWLFTIDTTPPVVRLVSPGNNSFSNASALNLTFNATDDAAVSLKCSLYFDGLLNQTNASVANNTNTNFTVSGLADGLHNWSVQCNDTANNTGTGTTRNFTVDTVAPVVTPASPANNSFFNVTSVTFNFTAVDNLSATFNCSIYFDGILNRTNTSITNNTNASFSVSGLQNGLHNWSVGCTDSAGNTGTSTTRTFTIDTVAPAVTLASPANNSFFNVTTVVFNFTAVNNLSATLNCSLYLDGILNRTNASVANSTNTNFTLSGLADGLHNWSVSCTDNSGNTGTSTARIFTLDTVAPAVTLVSPANNALLNTNSTNLSFIVVNNLSATLNCSLYLDGTLNQTNASVANNTNTNFTAINMQNGLHNWSVSCTDNSGNAGTGATRNFTINTAVPAITFTSPANNAFLNVTTVIFNFTAVSNLSATLNCSIYLDGILNRTNSSVANNTNTNFTVSGLADGPHNWSITCIDLANNTGTSGTRSFTVDTVAPAVTLASPANGSAANSTTVVFGFTATDNLSSTLNCTLFLDNVASATNASVLNNTPTTFSIPGVTLGDHFWRVECTDLALNTRISQTRNFTVDSDIPVVSLSSPANGSIFNVSSVTFNFSMIEETVSACSLYIDSVLNQTNSSVQNGTATLFSVSGIPDGSHDWNVSCTDQGNLTGYSQTFGFAVDAAGPSVNFTSPANDSFFNLTTVAFNFTVTDAISPTLNCSLYLDGVLNQTDPAVGNGTDASFIIIGLQDGLHNWSISCMGGANNTGTSGTSVFTVDTAAPVVTLLSPANAAFFNVSSVTFNFTAVNNLSATLNCSIYLDGILNQTDPSVANDTETGFAVTGLADGLHNWSVSCTDNSGNAGTGETRDFTIDTVVPVVILSSPANNISLNASTVSLNLTNPLNTTLNCSLYLDGVLNQTNPAIAGNSNASFTSTGLLDGLHNWSVRCTDSLGNNGTSETRNFTIDTVAPIVSLSAPANNTVFNATTVVFNFTAVDNLSATLNCSLLIDGSLTATNASVLNDTLTDFTVPGIDLGDHFWSVACTDSAGNMGMSEAWNFSVDTDAPVVVLSSPSNNTLFNTSSVTFNFTSSDAVHLTENCSLYIDGIKNQTNETVNNGTLTSFSVTGIPDGIHTWYVQCLDAAFNLGNSPTWRFAIDTIPPAVVLDSPEDGINTTNTTLALSFTVLSNSSTVLNCSLYLDSVLNQTNPSVLNGTPAEFIAPGVSQGSHTWNVLCIDNASNTGMGAPRAFLVYYSNVSALKLDQTAGQPSPGGTVGYNITIANTGNATLNVTALDTLPSGLTFLSASPLAGVSGQNVSWNFALASGGSAVLFLNATPEAGIVSVSTPLLVLTNTLNVTGLDSYGGTVTVGSTADVTIYYANVSVLKFDQTIAQPSPGGTVQFNMSLTNTGNVTMDPVQLMDTIPSGLTLYSASPNPDIVSGQTLTWSSMGPLAPGQSSTVFLNATVDEGTVSAATPRLNATNCVNITAYPPNGLGVSAAGCANVTLYYANVSVVKVDMTPMPPSPGGLVQWQINVSNPGEVPLDPVALSDVLPAGFQYSDAVPAPDTISPDNRTLSWNNIGPIAAGGSAVVSLNSTVDAGVANGTYANTANATGSPPNGNPATAGDSALVGISAPAINAVKTATHSVLTGRNVTFSVNVSNTGSANLTLTIVDTLPANITFLSASVAPTSVAGQVVTWAGFTVLAPGGSVLLTYVANATQPGTYDNNLTATGVPDNGNNVSDSGSAIFIVHNQSTTPPASSGGHAAPPLSISVASDCSGNVVSVTSDGGPVAGAEVIQNGGSIGTTGQDGQISFQGCGGDAIIRAEKSGYTMDSGDFQLVSCALCAPPPCSSDDNCSADEQCVSGSCTAVECACGVVSSHACHAYACCANADCGTGATCSAHRCMFECTDDSGCADAQYCDIPAGQAGGSCKDVQGCGTVANHALHPYECGSGAGCPSCPAESLCEAHLCVRYNLSGPANASVGDNITLHALRNGVPCALCNLSITLPDGRTVAGKTDSQGDLVLPITLQGSYAISISGGQITISIASSPRAAPPTVTPTTPTQTPIQDYYPPCLIAVILLLILFFILWKMRKKKKHVSETSDKPEKPVFWKGWLGS